MSIPPSFKGHIPRDVSKWKMTLMDPKYSLVIVEGATDRSLFQSFFKRPTIVDFPRPDSTNPHQSNKKSVIAALYELDQLHVKRVAGIVDADYDRVENKLHNKTNLFYTDEHDLEMQIIKSEALKKFLDNITQHERMKQFWKKSKGDWNKLTRMLIVDIAFEIGLYRMVAHSLDPTIPFPDIDERVCNLKMELKEETILAELEKNGLNRKNIIQSHHRMMNSTRKTLTYQVAKGHDATCLLAIALKKAISDKKSITSKDVEAQLRMSYEFLDFRKSKLFRTLISWARKNKIFLHLRN